MDALEANWRDLCDISVSRGIGLDDLCREYGIVISAICNHITPRPKMHVCTFRHYGWLRRRARFCGKCGAARS